MAAIGLIIGLAVGFLIVAAVIYYFQFGRQNEELPMHHTPHPGYVQQVPVQQVPVQHDVSTAMYTAPPPQPAYAANQVIYAQAPAPAYGAQLQGGNSGGYQGQGQGGGSRVSGASVAMGTAAGVAGGLLVGGLIASVGHSGGGHDDDDDGFAGDF